MRKSIILAAALAALAFAPAALAADMPLKAPVTNSFLSGYPYGGSGFYWGVYTEAGGGPVNGSVPGVGSASLTTTSAGVGGLAGYAWGLKSSSVFVAVEGMFGWTNYNGASQGLSLSGPAAFEQRFMVGTPLANFISLLPDLSNILGTVPPFPTMPTGVVVSNVQPYLMAAIHEDDISLNFPGLAANREWRIAPAVGIGMLGQLTNGVAIDAWVETIFPDKASCVGPVPGGQACVGLGQQVKVGASLKY